MAGKYGFFTCHFDLKMINQKSQKSLMFYFTLTLSVLIDTNPYTLFDTNP